MATKQFPIEVIGKAEAFAGRGVEQIRARVESDGSVLVWDDIAGHYTRCHSLAESDLVDIRRLAGVYAEDRWAQGDQDYRDALARQAAETSERARRSAVSASLQGGADPYTGDCTIDE